MLKSKLNSESKRDSYRFPTTGKRIARLDDRPKVIVAGDLENLPTSIQGEPVDSKEEARAAVATMALGWEIDFHYTIFGGREFRGGQVIDIVAYTVPKPTPVFVNGLYWHNMRGDADEELKSRWVDRRMSHYWMPSKTVWDYQLRSLSEAMLTMQLALGRPG